MRFGKASAYAVFATVYIAEHDEAEWVKGGAIAEACDIPIEYLLKILQQLVRAQVIHSERGRNGGFRLLKSARDTTLLEIFEAMEGPFEHEVDLPGGDASGRSRDFLQHLHWDIARYARLVFRRTTVEQLMLPSRVR